jgi:hypothetical protein
MQKSVLFVLLICAFVSTSLVNAQTLKLSSYSSSNSHWLAVSVIDGASETSFIEINEAGSATWTILPAVIPGWNYAPFSAPVPSGFVFPLSFRVTATSGAVITFNSAILSFTGVEQIVDSNTQYGSTTAATAAPVPVSVATDAPAAVATDAPAAVATDAPVVVAPAAPTGCESKVKVMVPLYVYPGAAWDVVAAGASSVGTLAIINPNSGPASSPDASYVTYMQKLHDAGVEMVGYVYTGYGTRDLAAVKADIDVYAAQYPLLSGIFLDEGANSAAMVPYYKALYDYILGMPGWTHDIVNPGVVPDIGYLTASTQIVSLEDYGTSVAAAPVPSYAQCSNRDQFSAIVHTISADSIAPIIDSLLSKDYFGYIYLTDGAGGCCTYNSLTTYYASMVSYIASKQ